MPDASDADRDALTGLHGRKLFQSLLGQAIDSARQSREPVALVHIGLDRFKVINGTLGHDAGDELLRAVAVRLNAVLRVGAPVARLGADEFVVLLEGQGDIESQAVFQAGAFMGRRHDAAAGTGRALHMQAADFRADRLGRVGPGGRAAF